MRLFRRDAKSPRQKAISREEIESLLPASVRHPEVNRFTPLGSDFAGEEGSDEDIEFLESIVKAVEHPEYMPAPAPGRITPKPPAAVPAAAVPAAATQDEALEFFRDMQAERDESQQQRVKIKVDDIEMFDLLEDLSTTAAALRRRKAA